MISSKTRALTVQCLSHNNRSNQKHFKGKLYEGPGLESLQLGRWFGKLSCFYKLFKSEHPHYLFKLIPSRSSSYITKNIHNIPFFKTRHTFFKNSFFPSTIIEWNKLDHNIRNSSSFNIFRKNILKFIRPSANSLFNCHLSLDCRLV